MKYNYNKLKWRIKAVYRTQKAFAIDLGLSAKSLSLLLNNKKEFTQDQIQRATELLQLNPDEIMGYFFTPEVQFF